MLSNIAKKIFGTKNERVLKSCTPLVSQINKLEPTYQKMSDEELKAQTGIFREQLSKGRTLDEILPEAFAVVREAGKRVLSMRHFDVQLVGGMILHGGRIAEMRTGEGKTLVSTLPAYLNALTGQGVHIVTTNDYLARRDAEWMGRLHRFLGLTVGVIYAGMKETEKREAYAADITYGQNNEFGFDYLRDNLKFDPSDQFQRGHSFAIVDEVDSILIDEARTPLIISGPAEDSSELYQRVNAIIPRLQKSKHFDIDLKTKQPTLTEEGTGECERLLGVDNLYDPTNIELLHHVNQALRAHTTMERDVDYVVKEGQILIVDEFTGRLMPGRRWSDGLHQAIEAKEGVRINRENRTLASITFQNYFRMYKKLSGMTGTADTEAVEFKTIYNLDVVVIPTNRPMIRADHSDMIFKSRREKYEAAIKDIIEINKTGQPILVGTVSIEQSEFLSKMIAMANVNHTVLNAKHHEKEAEIVAQAGRYGAVTISTNMAGRGTDIVLGGNPDFLSMAEAKTRDRTSPEYKNAFDKLAKQCAEERERVVAAGGLFIMGTERHESRRIDNQLRGRAGRQGDPGASRFYVSLEDDLMKRFGGDRMQVLMQRLGWEEGMSIDGRMVSRSIENAQKRVEAFHFDARKHVTEYDDVLNKQRQVIYGMRSRILSRQEIREEVMSMVDDLLEESVLSICDEKTKPAQWDLGKLKERYQQLFNSEFPSNQNFKLDSQEIYDWLRNCARKLYLEKMEIVEGKLSALRSVFTEHVLRPHGVKEEDADNPFDFSTQEIEEEVLLRTLDHLWNQHLSHMDHLREGIGLRGYGQKNPLHEYQREGFGLFQQLLFALREQVVRQLYFYQLPEPKEYLAHLEAERQRRAALERQMQMVHDGQQAAEGAGKQGPTPRQPGKKNRR